MSAKTFEIEIPFTIWGEGDPITPIMGVIWNKTEDRELTTSEYRERGKIRSQYVVQLAIEADNHDQVVRMLTNGLRRLLMRELP
jgi:hypothetical protein